MRTKKYWLLFTCLFLFSYMACGDNDDNNGGKTPEPTEKTERVEYKESDKILTNPERGFYTHRQYGTDDTNAMTADFVRGYREQGISLILNIYYMMDFRDKPISDAYLQRIRNNMEALREGGSKTVLRFAYTHNENQKPWDAPWEIVEGHIKQLEPIFKEYVDVIAVLEAGFVGVWGEWYYTDNFNFQPKPEDYVPRQKVLSALLKAVPKERMVSVRYPAAKLYTYQINYTDSITRSTAHDGSDLSRTSFHNDCFLADSDDRGTFGGNRNFRKYWEHESKYLVMGGETCAQSLYSTCENALKDMAKYHWSYINTDYQPAVISQWQREQCIDGIKKLLGYRIVMSEGTFAKEGEIGNPYEFELKLKNIGFAAPYNPRNVEVVFVSKQNSTNKYKMKLEEDPRFWFSQEDITIKAKFSLPSAMPTGDYIVYLNMPDPQPRIANRPEYSIQLANLETWDQTTGYNKLYTISVKEAGKKISFNGGSLVKF